MIHIQINISQPTRIRDALAAAHNCTIKEPLQTPGDFHEFAHDGFVIHAQRHEGDLFVIEDQEP